MLRSLLVSTSKVVIGQIELSRVDDEKAKREKFSRDVGRTLDRGTKWLGVRAKLPKKVY